MKVGDAIEKAVKPVAKALKMSCLDDEGQLKPESGCAKRRDRLNQLFHGNQTKGNMDAQQQQPKASNIIKNMVRIGIEKAGNGGWTLIRMAQGVRTTAAYGSREELLKDLPNQVPSDPV